MCKRMESNLLLHLIERHPVGRAGECREQNHCSKDGFTHGIPRRSQEYSSAFLTRGNHRFVGTLSNRHDITGFPRLPHPTRPTCSRAERVP
jgi:hypothetical protein